MAEEKIVRVNVSADSSGLSQEIKRAQSEMRDAFSDIGLGDMLDDADKKFDNVFDKINALKESLDEIKGKAAEAFEQDKDKGNDAYKANAYKRQADYIQRHEKAEEALEGYKKQVTSERDKVLIARDDRVNVRNRAMDVHVVNSGGGSGGGRGSEGSGSMGGMFGRNNKRVSDTLTDIGRSLKSGGQTGRLASVIRSLSGVLSRLGPAGLMAGGFIQLSRKGLAAAEEQDALTASTGINASYRRAYYNSGFSTMGDKDFDKFVNQVAASRGTAVGAPAEAQSRDAMMRAFGFDSSMFKQFDRFTFQGGSNSTDIIAEILKRSEQQGILRVSDGDFTRIPMVLEQVSGIMSMQKASSERVDEGFATSIAIAGQGIGGRFADDRLGSVMSRMNSSIQNPANGGMRAYIFEMLKRANPNASYTDILGKMESGASGENLQALLPQIANMQQGEMRRMVLFQLTKNWQDAIRLDSSDNLQQMMNAAKTSGQLTGDADYQQAVKSRAGGIKQGTTELGDALQKSINDKIIRFGEGLDKLIDVVSGRANRFGYTENNTGEFGSRIPSMHNVQFNQSKKPLTE